MRRRSSAALRIAVVGTGYGSVHIRNLQGRGDVDVVTVWSRTRDAAKAAARRLDVPSWETDLASIFARAPDAVVVATPPAAMREVVLRALDQGCHVLCEKPLGLTSAVARELFDAAESAGVVHMTNFDWRTVPDAVRLNVLARNGSLGEVERARITWLADGQARDAPWSWRYDRSVAGFGALRAYHHVLDEIHWHLGPVERVVADFQTFIQERVDQTTRATHECDVEDAVAFVAHTAAGARVVGDLDRAAAGRHVRATELAGDRATVRLTFPDPRDRSLTRLDVVGAVPEPVAVGQPTTQDAFVESIRSGADVPTSFRDGLAALMLAEAMREASEAGMWVQLPADYAQLFTRQPSATAPGTPPGH